LDLWDEIYPSSKELLGSEFLILVGCNVFFLLHPVEERERNDENSYCVLNIQEFGCREISVFMMGLSRNISFVTRPCCQQR